MHISLNLPDDVAATLDAMCKARFRSRPKMIGALIMAAATKEEQRGAREVSNAQSLSAILSALDDTMDGGN